jgi:5-methylcytosine-specific restriction endonuclease McrA
MFGKKREPNDTPFNHVDGCKILASDPGVELPWSEIRRGVWQRVCECSTEYFHEPVADHRVRLDPLDPKTARHLPHCEFVSETDPAVLRILLQVRPGTGGDYAWVTCNSCHASWPVPDYAESVG